MKLAFMALALCLYSSTALAQFFTGNDLYDDCGRANTIALGYVLGFTDSKIWGTIALTNDNQLVDIKQLMCLPPTTIARQVVDVVCKYLTNHPESRQLPAPYIVQSALTEAWPCS